MALLKSTKAVKITIGSFYSLEELNKSRGIKVVKKREKPNSNQFKARRSVLNWLWGVKGQPI